jgi:putative endonuclease
MLKCVSCRNKLSYVGYTKNLEKRLSLHNSGKGAKFTRGNNWKLIFKKKFITKNEAMSYEYILKNDKIKRKHIYNNSK